MNSLLLLFAPFAAILGACFGSFMNVCVWRIPRGESIVFPGSHCPTCNHPIPWYWNIPVLSWLILRGRCRWCKAPISARYIILELLTALLFLLAYLSVVSGSFSAARLFLYWLIIFGLMLGSFIDIEHYILPDRITIGGIILGLVVNPLLTYFGIPALLEPLALPAHGTLLGVSSAAFLGLATGFLGLWLVALLGSLAFRKEAMGFGDVKLMGAIGACFGWQAALFVFFAASFLGSIIGGGILLLQHFRKISPANTPEDLAPSAIPFGPYISLAAVIWMFGGNQIMAWYFSLLTRGL